MCAYDPRRQPPTMAHRPTGVRSGAAPRGTTRGGRGLPSFGGGQPPRRTSLDGRGPLILVAFLGLVAIAGGAVVLGGLGGAGASSAPGTASPGASAIAGASATPTPAGTAGPTETPAAPSPSDTPGNATNVPLVLVAGVKEPRLGLTTTAVRAALAAGTVAIPCGITSLKVGGRSVALPASTKCLVASKIPNQVRAKAGRLGLLPPGLVSARVKALQVGGADLFGGPAVRKKTYPILANVTAWAASWRTYDRADIRTLISTGDTCPDRGVSHQTNTLHKGWDWALNGGTAKYTGTHMDRRYDGPDGLGWPVVTAKRLGDAGKVKALISDAEITINDFECPMTAGFRQHDTGTVFSIDPKVAPFLKRNGIDLVTLASNHITDQGTDALQETLKIFDKAGIKHVGAGMTLAEALKPAVINVRGLKFAFVGWNSIVGSRAAGKSTAGVAWLTDKNVTASLKLARQQGDVVIGIPQWGWPEYHANFTPTQIAQRDKMFAAGADHVIGHGTHWAAAISITRGGARGDHFVISSHGNFLFGQDWSRQTQEGVVVELTFSGTRLVQARLHPYVMLDQAQANLTNPATDGKYVQNQVWSASKLP